MRFRAQRPEVHAGLGLRCYGQRMVATERCWWCGAPANLLCDSPLLTPAKRSPDGRVWGRPMMVLDPEPLTCDAVVCSACAESSQTTLVASAKERRADAPYWMSIDHCPFCVAIRGKHLGDIRNGLRQPLDADQHHEKCREHAQRNFRPRLSLALATAGTRAPASTPDSPPDGR